MISCAECGPSFSMARCLCLFNLLTKVNPCLFRVNMTCYFCYDSLMWLIVKCISLKYQIVIKINFQYIIVAIKVGRWYRNAQCVSLHCMYVHGFQLSSERVMTDLINTLRPIQNGRHFADNIFKSIFLNENLWILNEISLKYVPCGLIDKMAALVQIMAWHRTGDKPLSEAILICFTDAYKRHSAWLS